MYSEPSVQYCVEAPLASSLWIWVVYSDLHILLQSQLEVGCHLQVSSQMVCGPSLGFK